jgi:hypothetical protein
MFIVVLWWRFSNHFENQDENAWGHMNLGRHSCLFVLCFTWWTVCDIPVLNQKLIKRRHWISQNVTRFRRFFAVFYASSAVNAKWFCHGPPFSRPNCKVVKIQLLPFLNPKHYITVMCALWKLERDSTRQIDALIAQSCPARDKSIDYDICSFAVLRILVKSPVRRLVPCCTNSKYCTDRTKTSSRTSSHTHTHIDRLNRKHQPRKLVNPSKQNDLDNEVFSRVQSSVIWWLSFHGVEADDTIASAPTPYSWSAHDNEAPYARPWWDRL